MTDVTWSPQEERMRAVIARRAEVREAFDHGAQTVGALRLAIYFNLRDGEITDSPKALVFAERQAKRLLSLSQSREACQFIIEHLPGTDIAREAKEQLAHLRYVEAAGRKIWRIISARAHARTRRELTTA